MMLERMKYQSTNHTQGINHARHNECACSTCSSPALKLFLLVQPHTTPTPYWQWIVYIHVVCCSWPQPTTNKQSALRIEKSPLWDPDLSPSIPSRAYAFTVKCLYFASYRKSEKFCIQKFSCKKFLSKKIFGCERLSKITNTDNF